MLVAFRDQSSNRTPQMKERALLTAESFSVGKLAYFISDPAVEAIVKKDQPNSLLQPGGELTLSLMQNEKSRLKTLLEKNGYSNISSQAITFMMDTSFSSKNFSVKIIINLPNANNAMRKANSSAEGNGFEMADILKENKAENVAFNTTVDKDNTRMANALNNDDKLHTLKDKLYTAVK
jgi:hypothetical protein